MRETHFLGQLSTEGLPQFTRRRFNPDRVNGISMVALGMMDLSTACLNMKVRPIGLICSTASMKSIVFF
jgi:hypothetical protein